MMAFHAHSGWFFERLSDGDVRVFWQLPGEPVLADETFDAGTWASIVASVSIHGEDATSFHEAQGLHMGTEGDG